jgi:small multidrug resistance family-3 protein
MIDQPPAIFKSLFLFFFTALAELIGCYLPYWAIKQGKSLLWLIPAALSLICFVWLLSLHPAPSGRVYAAYGGVYIVVSLGWLKLIDGLSLSHWDLVGASIALIGASVIILQPSAR